MYYSSPNYFSCIVMPWSFDQHHWLSQTHASCSTSGGNHHCIHTAPDSLVHSFSPLLLCIKACGPDKDMVMAEKTIKADVRSIKLPADGWVLYELSYPGTTLQVLTNWLWTDRTDNSLSHHTVSHTICHSLVYILRRQAASGEHNRKLQDRPWPLSGFAVV